MLNLPTLPAELPVAQPIPNRSKRVNSGENLQAALDSLQAGDELLLEPGATFEGNYHLPSNAARLGWIQIRTDIAPLAPWVRATPATSAGYAKIVSRVSSPALRTRADSHQIMLADLEIALAHTEGGAIVELGSDERWQNDPALVASDLICDRLYVHAHAGANVRRGIALNSARTVILNSWIDEIHAYDDSQAIGGWNGIGPFKVMNNWLSAAGENFMLGGGDMRIPQASPADVEFRLNHCWKDPAWRGGSWSIKNLFELKHVKRILIEGNIFEYCWKASQTGRAIVLKVSGTTAMPWAVTEDVTFRRNIIRHAGGAFSIQGRDYRDPALGLRRILIEDNFCDDINAAVYGGTGNFLALTEGDNLTTPEIEGGEDIFVNHNTSFQSANMVIADGRVYPRFFFTNNLMPRGKYGIKGTETAGLPSIQFNFPDGLVSHNAIVGSKSWTWPAGNYFPADMAAVGFVDMTAGDYRLSDISPLKGAADDGTDIGCRFDLLNAAFQPPQPPPPVITESTLRLILSIKGENQAVAELERLLAQMAVEMTIERG